VVNDRARSEKGAMHPSHPIPSGTPRLIIMTITPTLPERPFDDNNSNKKRQGYNEEKKKRKTEKKIKE
jgi:hypothetical protein